MPGPHSMHWFVLVVVCGALTALGCATDTQGESGSLSLDLVLNGDTEIDEVQWKITRGGEEIKSGTINTSANGATASVEAFGLEPGDGYTITMEAVSTDGETTCKGSAMFSIEVGEVTEVHVMMNCKLPSEFGGVRVDGEFNICPSISMVIASPLQTSVGNDIDLSATANDDEGDPITYMWSSGSGIIADPMAASTIYTCTEVGDDVITILVTDDEGTYCMDMKTVDVTCVAGDGDPCEGVICEDTGNECTVAACNPSTGLCETSNVADGTDCNDAAGMCMDGTCVDKDLCMDVVCEDTGNECTTAVCNPSTGMCETSNVQDGTSCGDGGACMDGTCIETDPCEGVICDDTGNECTVGVCNSQTGVCDVMNVMDGTACLDNTGTCLAGTCEVGNQCDSVICDADPTDCIDGGTCNPSNGMCEGGGNEPIDTPCETDGVCDGQGLCVGCNDGTQCPDDTNECTMAACDMNQCGQANVMNGMMCDFAGMDDGVCEDGTCVAAPECVSPGDCNDGNPCTSGDCVDGMCSFIPVDGGSCEVSPGVPGTCSGGNCVQCTSANQCPADGNECTAASCVAGACGQANVSDGTSCDGGSGECQAGVCQPVGPPTYDLTSSIFKPYNSLLPALTGSGQPETDCNVPNLTAAPGNNLTGINTQCLIISSPDVNGSMTFDETSAGVFDVTGVQNLDFTIDVTIPAVSARVIINTNSSTAFSGTATGSLPGTLTMDPLTAPFNINADATGLANCQALNQLFIGFACDCPDGTECPACPFGTACPDPIMSDTPPCGQTCTNLMCDPTDVSTQVCPLANLGPGDNTVPLPGDPGVRTFPPITVTDADFNLGDGAAAVNGWYLSNPAPMAGNGTQWVHLAGVRTNP